MATTGAYPKTSVVYSAAPAFAMSDPIDTDGRGDAFDAHATADGRVARGRHVIAVGGGRPGVGKSLLSVNLAVYLAQLGRNVVLCDADPSGANLHTMLGCGGPALRPDRTGADTLGLVPTTVPGLTLMPATYDPRVLAPKRISRQAYWLRQLEKVDADYVVYNLGASLAPATLDLFASADVQICVAAPEPPAIDATYHFVRAYFVRRLRRTLMRERFKLRVLDRALDNLPALPSPRELIIEIARFDEPVADLGATVLASLRPRLVIGKTRMRRDLDLGAAMTSLAERYLGVALDYMGYVEHDDAVWTTARRGRPLLIDAPTSKAARDIERVARRLLALLAQPDRRAAEVPSGSARKLTVPLTLYKVLGVARTATEDEIRRAHNLQRDVYTSGSLPLVGLVNDRAMNEERARIAEAYDTLLEPMRRRAYDLSVFPDESTEPDPSTARGPSASDAELAALRAEVAREIGPDTQYSGPLLRRVRESLGIELADVANLTKISIGYLRAIETETYQALPAKVYVNGFLTQVSRALKLDTAQVAKSYLKRMRAARPDDG